MILSTQWHFAISSPFCSSLHVQDGQTALYIASNNGHGEIVKLLLKREADMDHETKVSVFMPCIRKCSLN